MNTGFVKNIFIAGFTGGGKTFVMMYIVIDYCSKVLTVITVAMMFHQSIQLCGWNWHKFLFIHVDYDKTCLSTECQNLPFRNYNSFQTELGSFRVFILFPMPKLVKLLPNLIM